MEVKVSDRFLSFHAAVHRYMDCEQAAERILAGEDCSLVFAGLHNNGSWGVVPWPEAALIAAVSRVRGAIDDKTAPVPYKRHPNLYALDAMTFALTEVFGIKSPYAE